MPQRIFICICKPEGRVLKSHDFLTNRTMFRFVPVVDLRLMLQNRFQTVQADTSAGQQNDDHLCHNEVKQDQNGVFRQRCDISDLHIAQTNLVAAQPQNQHNTEVDGKK